MLNVEAGGKKGAVTKGNRATKGKDAEFVIKEARKATLQMVDVDEDEDFIPPLQ